MLTVCADYCGSPVMLRQFNDFESATEFMKHDYVIFHADEIENAEEDEIISKNEMYITDELPFEDMPSEKEEIWIKYQGSDELPF